MTIAPIPRLPDPLTPETIEPLMKARAPIGAHHYDARGDSPARPYWDTSHPRSPIYRRLVQRGFEIMYPGPLRRDAIGRQIDTQPLKPQYIAHLVAKENREMDELEREFDERGGADGAVHVQSHARDGGKTEVADYWRARPGEGAGSDDLPKPRNLLDEAERAGNEDDASETQAGTDDDRSKPVNPLPDLPEIEIRDDKRGDGNFGVSRERPDGTKYDHEGVDIKAPPGTPVKSPVDGEIDRITDAYKRGPLVGQFQAITIKGDDGQEYKFLYVTPRDGDGNILVKDKDRVRSGDPIGTVQDRAAQDKSGQMDNHIHIEIRDKSGQIVDPTPDVEEWQKRP